MSYILENKHGLEDSIIGKNVMDDLFVSTDERAMDIDNEMDPADDDIFNDLFVDWVNVFEMKEICCNYFVSYLQV